MRFVLSLAFCSLTNTVVNVRNDIVPSNEFYNLGMDLVSGQAKQ
jgi:hypothetical protein